MYEVLCALLRVDYICIHARLLWSETFVCTHQMNIPLNLPWMNSHLISVLFSHIRTLARYHSSDARANIRHVFLLVLTSLAGRSCPRKVLCFSRHVSHEPRSETGWDWTTIPLPQRTTQLLTHWKTGQPNKDLSRSNHENSAVAAHRSPCLPCISYLDQMMFLCVSCLTALSFTAQFYGEEWRVS